MPVALVGRARGGNQIAVLQFLLAPGRSPVSDRLSAIRAETGRVKARSGNATVTR